MAEPLWCILEQDTDIWYKTEGQEIVPTQLKMVDLDEKHQSKHTFYPLLST